MGLEVGLKATIRHNDNDFEGEDYNYDTQTYLNNANMTNRFVYHEQVYARVRVVVACV